MKSKRILAAVSALGVAAALAVPTMLAAPAVAEDGAKEVVSVVPLEGALSEEELVDGTVIGEGVVDRDDYTSEGSPLRFRDGVGALAERPSSFDLRDAAFHGATGSFVTPVKNQSPFGTCWSFGAIAAAESSYLTERGIPVTDPESSLDLSEKHLAWFAMAPVADDGNGQRGEGFYNGADAASESSSRYEGGTLYDATTLFSTLTGPIDESTDPSLEYHNAAGDYVPSTLGDGYVNPSEEGDWSIDDKWRDVATMELEESLVLPSPASIETGPETGDETYTYNQQGVDAIKDQLLEGRAVAISFHADQALPEQTANGQYLNLETWAQYTYDTVGVNHGVCIVGYDDDYPVANFNDEVPPPGPGAFIVKNSWGAVDSTYGNQANWGVDGSGFFYLSYYDQTIRQPEAYDFVTPNDDDLSFGKDPEEQTVSQYQYSYLPGEAYSKNYDAVMSAANVFEIEKDAVVRDVTTQTLSFDTDVRYDIYRLADGATDPTDGELLWSRDAHYPYGGFHRAELERPLIVGEGDRIAVVVTTRLPDGRSELMQNFYYSRLGAKASPKDLFTVIATPFHEKWAEAVVNEGESFLGSPSRMVEYSDGSYDYEGYAWADLSSGLAERYAKAEAALADLGVEGLEQDLDAAYPAYREALEFMDEHDYGYFSNEPGMDECRDAIDVYLEASGELYSAVEPYMHEDTYDECAAFYVWDNYPINLTTEAYDAENPPVAAEVELFRLYNPYTGEHLYTEDAVERAALTAAGWRDEGTGWTAPARSNTPVHRLYNAYTGEHLYIASDVERQSLVAAGWTDEGVKFHSDGARTTPVYRLENPYTDGVDGHHFTTDRNERDALVSRGWRTEGIAWYGA